MASWCSPNLSTATKKTNQVDIDKKYCNIVNDEISRILPKSLGLKEWRKLVRPYFLKLTVA